MLNKGKHSFAYRRAWTRIETRTLLVFAIHRKDEFDHIYKKRSIYKNLVEDLTSSEVSEVPYTEQQLKIKLANLRKAYRQSVDNNSRTGVGYAIEPFKDLLEDLFTTERSTEASENQTVTSGVDSPLKPINVRRQIEGTAQSNSNKSTFDDDSGILSNSLTTNVDDDDLIEVSLPEEDQSQVIGKEKQQKTPRKRKTPQDKYREMNFEFLREKETNKQKRHEEKLRRKAEREEAIQKRHEERQKWNDELLKYLQQNKNKQYYCVKFI